jgi:glutaredoxin/transposase-like protein
MEEHLICPWCLTEIVWDEEIGPESHCPHCDNELSAYRTIELGYDEDEVEEDEHERSVQALKINDSRRAAKNGAFEQDEWSEDEAAEEEEEDDSDDPNHKRWLEQGDGYRSADSARFAVEETIQRVLDDQDEVPECPVCRSYMIEAGVQMVGDQNFESRIAPSLGGPVLTTPFKLSMYVCPACYHTSSMLSLSDREQMIKRLTPKE